MQSAFRHPVDQVPGRVVLVPVPSPTLAESGLGVEPALVQVDVVAEQLADGSEQTREGEETLEWLGVHVRAKGKAGRRFVVALTDDLGAFTPQDLRDRPLEDGNLVVVKQVREEQVTAAIELFDLRFVELHGVPFRVRVVGALL